MRARASYGILTHLIYCVGDSQLTLCIDKHKGSTPLKVEEYLALRNGWGGLWMRQSIP